MKAVTEDYKNVPNDIMEKAIQLEFKVKRLQGYINENNLPFVVALNTNNLMKLGNFELRMFYRFFASQISYLMNTKEEVDLTSEQKLNINTIMPQYPSQNSVLNSMIKEGKIT
ncbi:hypothetical protein ACKUCE_11855 [Flavobacterium psychrophilum]|uniref:hypothetical protein n=1 Tax=Flavobacterium psychrophilum TaxID=96345 RepID=UPI0004E7D02E|nr:hypothetical protein [Flavobacterium psychrophilum]AIJ37101.1 hypothetical protein FPSM_00605 [Flavobacterium psychrophilum]AIN72766.1 hypothetical protein FPG101_02890 [Flavobacterium psychrophilum FPG101]EKT3975135.1 hypothetical protein [Flavobacterium psychrophilum]EKT4527411.1 hypothetical protein [Flavobacterium psychrophilum]EKT4535365.1 hypothetical protein [Flavobacterium psychrophilum]